MRLQRCPGQGHGAINRNNRNIMAASGTTPRLPILIIEDDDEIAFVLKFLLKREGFDVHHASDGRKAAEMIERMSPPSLVLCDIKLPFMDGFQLVALMRGKVAWKDTPIIMLTAKTMEGDIVRALNIGANDYIPKPFSPKELVARLRRFLK